MRAKYLTSNRNYISEACQTLRWKCIYKKSDAKRWSNVSVTAQNIIKMIFVDHLLKYKATQKQWSEMYYSMQTKIYQWMMWRIDIRWRTTHTQTI